MSSSDKQPWSAGLPYVNNLPIILLTAAVNIACFVFFYYGKGLTHEMVMTDARNCGITTSFIDVFLVWQIMKKRRAAGKLPAQVPCSRLMSALPKNPLWLSLTLAVVFAFVTPLVNGLFLRFYQVNDIVFYRFALWRIIYSVVLSVYIVQIAIFRYVQPDCAAAGEVQSGGGEVINPLPRISVFKQWFNTVSDDFGFNVLIGLLLGGTSIQGYDVIIKPAALAGIHYSALALGVIVTARMVYPVTKQLRGARDSGSLPVLPETDRRIAWIPQSPAKFALVLMLPVILGTYVFFRSVLTFFGFDVLNFFQFFVIRTLWTTLLTKAVVKLAIWRYIQPEPAEKI